MQKLGEPAGEIVGIESLAGDVAPCAFVRKGIAGRTHAAAPS